VRNADAREREPATMWSRDDVVLRGGLRLAVFAAGRARGEAPTLVLVHGLGHWTQAAWDRLAALLGDAYHLVAFDLPGFGDSDKPDARYDPDFFVDTLGALVDHLRLDGFGLVGHSLGGLIAASYAARAPERVSLLALLDPAGFRRTGRLVLLAAASRPAAWIFGFRPPDRLVARTLERATVDPSVVPKSDYERAVRLARDPAYRRAFARVYASALPAVLALDALHRRLTEYRGPVLLFWGRHDRYVPIGALTGARRVYPHADVTILERSAHLPQVEEPEPVAARLRAAFPLAHADAAATAPNGAP